MLNAASESPAVPSLTLIAMLRTIAAAWQQETVAESAREVHQLGRELYERLGVLGKHFAKLGRSLDGAVGAYNDAVGSIGNVALAATSLVVSGMDGGGGLDCPAATECLSQLDCVSVSCTAGVCD